MYERLRQNIRRDEDVAAERAETLTVFSKQVQQGGGAGQRLHLAHRRALPTRPVVPLTVTS